MSGKFPEPREPRSGEEHGRLWPFLLILGLIMAVAVYFAPIEQDETPPEPVDPTTRAACRGWQVVLAATGIEDISDTDWVERDVMAEDFISRAETVALTRNAEQGTFLAVVDAIASARAVRDASGKSDVYMANLAFSEDLAAVGTTCEQG